MMVVVVVVDRHHADGFSAVEVCVRVEPRKGGGRRKEEDGDDVGRYGDSRFHDGMGACGDDRMTVAT